MNDTYTAAPAFTVSNVSGVIGTPASSLTAEMLAAQRTDAISMKSVAFAICRPTQILWLVNVIEVYYHRWQCGHTLDRTPVTEASVSREKENIRY